MLNELNGLPINVNRHTGGLENDDSVVIRCTAVNRHTGGLEN